jgi:Tfp pilus assembly protein PilX
VKRLLRQEDGIALLMALGIMLVLTIATVSMISYTSSGQRATRSSAGALLATQYAEAGLNAAYSILNYQLTVTGGNPSSANLLGCNGATGPSDTNGPSNCATPSAKLFCFSSGCTAGSDGSATVYGYYSGTNPQTFLGMSIPAATWVLVSNGYARNSNGVTTGKTAMATAKINPISNGTVAAVWNHIFLTAPLVANQCQTDFESNNLVLDVPLYVIGNLCFSGDNNVIKEVGQPVDVQIGGKLVINGNNNNSVGVSASIPITSGVVVGGCTNVSVSSATTPCSSGSYKYWVTTTDTFNPQSAPVQSTSDIQADYANFDPGPKHPCQAGGIAFDTDTTYNNSASSFELTPNSSYSCISQNGASVGQLTWDNAAKRLTINGSIFFDGSVTISQSAYYVGTAIIEVAGTVSINNNSTTVCATSPCNTGLAAWQGSSGNNSMLTFAPLSGGKSMTLAGNLQTFQGSIWTQPSATLALSGNNATVEGPMSIGTIYMPSNDAQLKPLPVIKNMPVGAPIPPNTNASVGPLVTTK